MNIKVDLNSSIAADKQNKTLNKPFRTPKGPKKFGVYVKNDKGNVVLVRFGDPNMEIKRDDPNRRKNFRARHQCDSNPGPKWKARYWSCKMWEKGKSVTEYTKGLEASWDGKQLWDQDHLLLINPSLASAQESDESDECGCGNGCGCNHSQASSEESVEMAKSQLKKASDQLLELIDIMGSQQEVEGWVLSKVTKIEDYVDAIYGYLKYNDDAEKQIGITDN
jgi:hypothetical protein